MRRFLFFALLASAFTGCTDTSKFKALTTAKSHMGLVSKTITVNSLNFHYVEKGSGDLMLFLHGFPYFSEVWYKQIHAFGNRFHAVAPDNRGYGYTDKPENVSDYHLAKLVSDVEQLITKLSPNKKVILVGHDWGAALAWGTAQLHPNLIKKIIIINGVPSNAFLNVLGNSEKQREKSKYIGKLDSWLVKLLFAVKGPEMIWQGVSRLHEAGQVDDAFKQAFLTAWDQPQAAQSAINWYAANFPEFDNIQAQDYWPSKQARVTVPSLLIWSKNDPAFTDEVFNAIPQYVDDLTIKVIDTDSHAPFIDHSEKVITFMEEFIQN
ncbi:alpha/beta hydrolase [uncultured Paraglaciecola sp.]|uniref:alpha/beta fold hydrolase n=1 Tax=uncultured Paraglaciecola sp. TaxID=1765024 RepID=UPI0026184A4A|nr:alpha/beta hydrolase [uncultured Paraglaciecola sp.]